MPVAIKKGSLNGAQRRLLELMQSINFGRIEGVTVKDGDPLFDPLPRVVREVKFGGVNGPRPELGSRDFELKAQVVRLFERLSQIGDAKIESIEVQHGLPFRMHVEEKLSA